MINEFQGSLKYYKDRIENIAKSVFVYDLGSDYDCAELTDQLLNAPTQTEKIAALLKMIGNRFGLSLPKKTRDNLKEQYANQYLRHLPLDFENYELTEKIGQGGESDVFLLKSKNKECESFVVKLRRPKRLLKNNELTTAKRLKNDHTLVEGVYSDLPGFIPNQLYLLANKEQADAEGVIIILQKFFGNDLRDLFKLSIDEIVKICSTDEKFKQMLLKFIEITLTNEKKTGQVIDFLGTKNISVISNDSNEHSLVLIDGHMFKIDEENSKKRELFRKGLLFLSNLQYRLNNL